MRKIIEATNKISINKNLNTTDFGKESIMP
jgi:hypothetical protein